ncbi:MAG: hypothetical protein MI702_00745, partial [Chlorobiales bacterium]|nr:hypothetical protein [Chlorobiales bacterium]
LKRKRMLFLGLCLANELLDAPVPEEISKEMRNDPLVRKFTLQVTGTIFGERTMKHQVLSSFIFRLNTRETMRDKLYFCLGRFVLPDPLDFGFLRLPPSLFFCYFLLRPIRLVARYFPNAIKKLAPAERV